jgi:uncharacterized protein DUF3499
VTHDPVRSDPIDTVWRGGHLHLDALSSTFVRSVRKCSRTGCGHPAVATLTYAYADSTAVVGPLATYSEPHSYDLCEEHALRLTVPRGWEVVRHDGEFAAPEPTVDDLTALAEAVREAGRPDRPIEPLPEPDRQNTGGRRGHLRVLPNPVAE